jgi:hypothetical protein
MLDRRPVIVREFGTALAVLAIYLLTLLLPLHQAAGLQRDLATLGFEPIDAWSICAPLATGTDQQQPTAVKCPAAGIAKQDFVAVLPPVLVLAPAAPITVGFGFEAVLAATGGPPDHFGQSRAPPMPA